MNKVVAALVLMVGACWNPPGVSGVERVTEPAREVSVAHDVDVVVAGGGISGVFAALGAAQGGASVVLIERFETVGGTAGPGMNTSGGIQPVGRGPLDAYEAGQTPVPFLWVYPELAGIPKRFAQRVAALTGPDWNMLDQSNTGVRLPRWPHAAGWRRATSMCEHCRGHCWQTVSTLATRRSSKKWG